MNTDITIRAVEPADFPAVKAIYEQPGAYTGTLQMPFPSEHSWRERLAKPPGDAWFLVACKDTMPVGHIGLMIAPNPRRRHSAHIGMAVRDDHAGRGIGEALMRSVLDIADNWLALTRVELTVYTDNDRAIALYRRVGFEVEGTLRRYAFRNGEYVDALTMARLR